MPAKRIDSYDLLRGIGILLVVTHHVAWWPAFRQWDQGCLIAIFFFVGGVFQRATDGWRISLWRRFCRLMVPYFAVAFVSFAYWALCERHFRPDSLDVGQELANLFWPMNRRPVADVFEPHVYNVVLWFLPTYFVGSTLFDAALRLCRTPVKMLGATAAFVVLAQVNPWYAPFYLPQALGYVPFMCLGWFVGRWREPIDRAVCAGRLPTALVSAGLLALSVLWSVPGVESRFADFGSCYVRYAAVATLGVAAAFGLCSALGHCRVLQWLGVHSLGIMLIHDPIKRVAIFVLKRLTGVEVEILRTAPWGVAACVILTLGVSVGLLALADTAVRRLRSRS